MSSSSSPNNNDSGRGRGKGKGKGDFTSPFASPDKKKTSTLPGKSTATREYHEGNNASDDPDSPPHISSASDSEKSSDAMAHGKRKGKATVPSPSSDKESPSSSSNPFGVANFGSDDEDGGGSVGGRLPPSPSDDLLNADLSSIMGASEMDCCAREEGASDGERRRRLREYIKSLESVEKVKEKKRERDEEEKGEGK